MRTTTDGKPSVSIGSHEAPASILKKVNGAYPDFANIPPTQPKTMDPANLRLIRKHFEVNCPRVELVNPGLKGPAYTRELWRDLDALSNTEPLPCDWDLDIYRDVLTLDEAGSLQRISNKQRQQQRAAENRLPTQPLQETSVRRSAHLMATVLTDDRWKVGKWVLIKPEFGEADKGVPFWVGQITRGVEISPGTSESPEVALIQVQWWEPTPGRPYTGNLYPCVVNGDDPFVDEIELESVITSFVPRLGKGGKRITVPAAHFKG